jgi:cytochrome c oxidase subunit IV
MQHGSSQPHEETHAQEESHAAAGTPGAHVETAAHPHIVPVATYLKVFVSLMILWVLTSACARIDLDERLHVHGIAFVVAFCIALTKALLIVLIFMHVKYSTKITWVFAAAAFLWLGILFAITFADYLSRGAVVPDDTPVRLPGQVQEIPQGHNEMSGIPAPKP